MKSILTLVLACLSLSLVAQRTLPKAISIQAPIVNLRQEPNLKAPIVVKLKQMDYVSVIEKGKSDTIDGITDFWYKVKSDDKVGYVFGHLTSLKLAGRHTEILTYTECGSGDYFHIQFGDKDFGDGQNNYEEYSDLCIEPAKPDEETHANPKYVGKRFELILNTIIVRAYCGGGSMEICNRPVESIISMRLLDK